MSLGEYMDPLIWFLTSPKLVTVVRLNHMYVPAGFNLTFIILEFIFAYDSFISFILLFDSVFFFSKVLSLLCIER